MYLASSISSDLVCFHVPSVFVSPSKAAAISSDVMSGRVSSYLMTLWVLSSSRYCVAIPIFIYQVVCYLDITHICTMRIRPPSYLASSDNPDKLSWVSPSTLQTVNWWRHNEYSCCWHTSFLYSFHAHHCQLLNFPPHCLCPVKGTA